MAKVPDILVKINIERTTKVEDSLRRLVTLDDRQETSIAKWKAAYEEAHRVIRELDKSGTIDV